MATEAQLLEEAKTATTCLEWTRYCKAECCDTLYVIGTYDLKKAGALLHVEAQLPPHMINYYALRHITYRGGVVTYLTSHCKQEEGRVLVKASCKHLTKDFKCRIHGEHKPSMCQELTREFVPEGSTYTPRCLFKYQQMLKEGEHHGEEVCREEGEQHAEVPARTAARLPEAAPQDPSRE